ncbi:hypothetical protein XIS1_1440038 [Xenorhabdus innexi]|uniref:Uncharacterized protein n=1 Tax=Xenorhabdus innexi TaxID=290109 RepID=A0A1N6MUC1_9GAMM|nr:hypothetical protein XIS1_1440038 [Xenorhabdus innexi]
MLGDIYTQFIERTNQKHYVMNFMKNPNDKIILCKISHKYFCIKLLG